MNRLSFSSIGYQTVERGDVMGEKKYRLVTRSDFDGLVCAVLLKELDLIDEIIFVHPKDMQDGKIDITENDITTNLPYNEKAHLVFDHHLSEVIRTKGNKSNHIIEPESPSAARVVYNYYKDEGKFNRIPNEMMLAVDKSDSAQFTLDDILAPSGWELLNFIMDARTGLGRYQDFKISNYKLMMELIDHCLDYTIDEILMMPDVKERVDFYKHHFEKFKLQLLKCGRTIGKALIIDFRDEENILAGNRFVKYALWPEAEVSIQIIWGLRKQNTVFAVGKSIFNKESELNIGELMLKYGGGGHMNAGTCQIDHNDSDTVLLEIIDQINK